MTVPTLMQNYQRKSYVTQLHKVYNEVQQATVQYMTDRNAINLAEAGLRSEDAGVNFVKQYFKVVQDCGDDAAPCFAELSSYHKLSGDVLTKWWGKKNFVLANGAAISTYYHSAPPMIMEIVVDVNGAKGPNVVGRDLFIMYLYNNGALDDLWFTNGSYVGDDTEINSGIPIPKDQREKRFQNYCQSNSGVNYHGCFGKILNDNWEMTY